ncbi:MAG: glycerol kinase GlpK [Spirochaetia bacterium]|nr:glycerol kinase GlpK [Spirochaetia bacterium]
MKGSFVIALDQGTTSSRAVLVDQNGSICDIAQKEFTQYFPQPGWVEHDPEEIYNSQRWAFEEILRKNNLQESEIKAIGITNQRETTIVWERSTGKVISNAIVWQDRRTAKICDALTADGFGDYVRDNTGLVIDAYFSGTKIQWMLENVPGAREKANRGELLFGTVDTWLIWKLTEGRVHATDYSNASRTMLFNIRKLDWDETLLKAMNIPRSMLPEVRNSSGHFGELVHKSHTIPITGVAGDQQAALFGNACFKTGTSKNTYGTGCFMLMNTGDKVIQSKSGLVSTIAWGIENKVSYALEGSVFIAGAAIQWLRDGLHLIKSAGETFECAERSYQRNPENPVYVVPAFAGLGAPYWDMYARGAIFGLTRDTSSDDIARATLESMAYQTRDIAEAMVNDSGIDMQKLRVDGGACANNFLMAFQADILGVPVERPKVLESTALGAASLAGLAVGMWSMEDLSSHKEIERTFQPSLNKSQRNNLYHNWQRAVKRSMRWIEDSQ